MDEGLHFEITGENESLKQAVRESEQLIDDLGEKAEVAGEKLKHIFESGSFITADDIKNAFSDFSLDEYSKEIEAFSERGGDLASQFQTLSTAWGDAHKYIGQFGDEWIQVADNIKQAQTVLARFLVSDEELNNLGFHIDKGDHELLTDEDVERLRAAQEETRKREAEEMRLQAAIESRKAAERKEEPNPGDIYPEVDNRPMWDVSHLKKTPTPTTPPSGGGNVPPVDTRSIQEIEKEIANLDKTIDSVSKRTPEITAMFDSFRSADAAAMSIGKLHHANDDIADGYDKLDSAQTAYNTKIADLEALAKKQEDALTNLKQKQEEAFANNDSRGAAQAISDYAEMQEKLKQTQERLEQTKTASENLGAIIDNNADVQVRYNQVLDAANTADATKSIEELRAAFDAEKEKVKELEEQMKPLQDEYADLQERMKGKLSSGEETAVTARMEQLRKKIGDVASEYQTASDRANKFGEKIGQSVSAKKVDLGSGDDGGKAAGSVSKVGKAASETGKQLGALRTNITSITRGFSAMSKGGAGVMAGLAGIGKGVMGLSAQLMALLANPIVAIIAAIAAALMVLYKIVMSFINGTSAGKDMFASWIGYVKGFKAAIEQFIMEVSRKVAEFVKNIGSFFSSIGAAINVVWSSVKAIFTNGFKDVIPIISSALKGVFTWIESSFFDALGGIKNLWTKFKAWIKGEEVKPEDLVDTNTADKAFDGLNKTLSDFAKNNKEVGDSLKNLKEKWGDFKGGFSDFNAPSFKDFMNTYARIEELQRGIIRKQREWTVASAQLEQQQSDLQNKLDRAGNVEKLQTMVQLKDTIQKKYDGELSIARDELKVQKKINRPKGKNVSDDDLKKEADLKAKVMGIEQKRKNEVRSLKNQHIDLTRQLEEERREQQRILANNTRDKEIAALQQQLKYEKDLTKQLEIQDQIRQKQLEKELEGINKQQQSTIKTSLGAKAEQAFAKGANKKELKSLFVGNDAALAEIDRIFAYYNQLRDDAISKSQQEGMFSNFDKELENMQKYVDETIAIEQERQDALREIAESSMSQREKDRQAEVVNGVAAEKQKIADKNAGFDKDGDQNGEVLANRLTSFGVSIADKTFEEIRELYQQFLGELGDDIQSLEQQNQAIDMYTSATSQLESGVGADGEELTEEQKVELERQKAEYGALLIQYGIEAAEVDNVRAENAKKLIALEQAKTMAEGTYVSAIEKQSRKESDQAVVSRARWNTTRDALALVGSTARSVSDTFGDYMSDSTKKAVDTVGSLVDIAMGAIDSISSFTKGTTEAMKVSSVTASESIKSLEKASVVLAIISAAIQAAMAIARLFMGKTAFEKAMDKVNAQVEVVKELKKAQEDLERTYKRSSGTKHYSDMAKAAQAYDSVIQEQQKAVRMSEEALESAKKKEKKEAKSNLEEQERALQEYKDAQYELYQELQNELLTTNVTSFSENLADALVEGFEDGTTSISDTWDNVLNDLMKSMMKKQLSLALADMFDETFQKFNTYVIDGQLTEAHMQTIMNELDAKSQEAELIAAQYQKMMSEMGLLDDANPESDKGGFQSMSQDTADELNARFTALQIEGAQVVTASNDILDGMQILQANSDRFITFVQDIDRYQQLAYEQSQEHLDVIRAISDTAVTISKHTARLKAIEQNTDRL